MGSGAGALAGAVTAVSPGWRTLRLYASGNTMAAVTGPVYPAPGTPLGTAMVFAHRAVLRMAQLPST